MSDFQFGGYFVVISIIGIVAIVLAWKARQLDKETTERLKRLGPQESDGQA